jgi:hypothetical protein
VNFCVLKGTVSEDYMSIEDNRFLLGVLQHCLNEDSYNIFKIWRNVIHFLEGICPLSNYLTIRHTPEQAQEQIMSSEE